MFYLPLLPPHSSNPLYPRLYIIPLLQQLQTPITLRQLFIRPTPMHKAMTSPTQPRNTIQHILIMPSPFQNPLVRTLGYQMMVRQWYPLSMT